MMAGVVLALMLLGPDRPAGHAIHVSYGRVAVEGKAVTIRLRMFQDDLSKALARYHRRDTVDIEARPLADSLAMAYLSQTLLLSVDGKPLVGGIAGAGREDKMWWFLVRYPLIARAGKLTIANRIFFELFEDQQNLLKVVHLGSGDETSLYFGPREPGPVTLTFKPS